MSLNSYTLKKRYERNVYSNSKFRLWKYDIPCDSEEKIMAEVSGHTSEKVCYKTFSWYKLNLTYDTPQGQDFTKSYQCFPWWKLSLVHGNQHSKSTKNKNSEIRWNPRWKGAENSWLEQVKRLRNRVDK